MNHLVELVQQFVHIILHLDQYLSAWMVWMGPWLYVLMFLIIFAETGLVVTPFLPGDSLLFALGALTTVENGLNIWLLIGSLLIAAIIGDNVNYAFGKYVGPKVFQSKSKIFKKEYLDQTKAFYDKYGGQAVVWARFIPIVRTYVPFVAGVGAMTQKKFQTFNVLGAILWINIFLWAGRIFGNLPQVKSNFHIVIFGVIFVSILPMVFAYIKAKRSHTQKL